MNGGGGSLRSLRWVILIAFLALVLVLLASGHLLVGALLCALAAFRIVLILLFARRRRAFSDRRNSDPVHRLLRRLARREFTVAANAMGMEPAQLRQEFTRGARLPR